MFDKLVNIKPKKKLGELAETQDKVILAGKTNLLEKLP